MCRLVEKVYLQHDGSRRRVEEKAYCHRARRPDFCNNVAKKTTEYYDTPSLGDDPVHSPVSGVPTTPPGTVSYRTQTREPSGLTRRPSTKEGAKKPRPAHIVINLESRKKDKSKKYHDAGKRSSLGARSVASSNEFNLDSPGSASPIQTGFPETTPSAYPLGGYTTVTVRPGSHHRHSSSSSFTTSQTPSLYTTSDVEHPPAAERSNNHRSSTVIHNPDPRRDTSPPRTLRPTPPTGANYREVTPNTSNSNVADGGLYPLDYSDPRIPSNPSSANSSRVVSPGMSDREAEDALQRLRNEIQRKKDDADKQLREAEKRKHEDAKRAKALAEEEEARQARIELERYKGRAKERAENQLAEYEKRRHEEREKFRAERKAREEREAKAKAIKEEKERLDERDAREKERKEKEAREAKARLEKEAKEKKERAAKKERNRMEEEIARRKKQAAETEPKEVRFADEQQQPRKDRESKDRESRYPGHENPPASTRKSRRASISNDQAEQERARLLATTAAQMQREREATELREAQERQAQAQALLWQQQQQQQAAQQTAYYNPRQDDRVAINNEGPGIGRRNSISARRPSLSGATRPVSLHQAALPVQYPPAHNTSSDGVNYSMRGPAMPTAAPQAPPVRQHGPPPSRHYSVYDPGYAPTSYGAPSPYTDTRNQPPAYSTREIQPPAHLARRLSNSHERPTLRERGERVISQAEASERARNATRNLAKAARYGPDDPTDSEDDLYDAPDRRRGHPKTKRPY